jgi:hypothetical protein
MLSTNRKRPWQGVIGDRCTNITDRAAGFQRREGSRPRDPFVPEARGLLCARAEIHQAVAHLFTARGDARPPQGFRRSSRSDSPLATTAAEKG